MQTVSQGARGRNEKPVSACPPPLCYVRSKAAAGTGWSRDGRGDRVGSGRAGMRTRRGWGGETEQDEE
eukprot:9376760-Pyramimonas_sp.AAC.1